jgi:hypothetical protein
MRRSREAVASKRRAVPWTTPTAPGPRPTRHTAPRMPWALYSIREHAVPYRIASGSILGSCDTWCGGGSSSGRRYNTGNGQGDELLEDGAMHADRSADAILASSQPASHGRRLRVDDMHASARVPTTEKNAAFGGGIPPGTPSFSFPLPIHR